MQLAPYRQVLSLPGVRALMLVALVARIPVVAVGVTLTLHVVLDLRGSYAAAGTLGAVFTVASAVGAPLLGRLVDRRSLRTVLGLSTAAEGVYWAVAPSLNYAALLVASLLLGLLTMPVFSVVRQSIAALVPEAQRRQAYALDSMAVELSFMVGPAAAVLLVTKTSPTFAMYAVGAAIVLAGLLLYVQNPPVRGDGEQHGDLRRVPRRQWLRPRFVALLVISAATTATLAGTDIALVAELRGTGQVAWIGVVLAAWGAYSMAGGFVYGAVHRTVPTVVLLGLLGAFTIPVGLVNGAGWLALALIPAGALCAPTLASGADAISRIVPAAARGEAMGLHSSALTLGLAAGAPLAGAVIDATAPAWGFAVVGAVTLGVALALAPFAGRISRAPDTRPTDGTGPHLAAPPASSGPSGSAGLAATGPTSTAAEPATVQITPTAQPTFASR
jgi:predicted MFS family arabinose efflux permease